MRARVGPLPAAAAVDDHAAAASDTVSPRPCHSARRERRGGPGERLHAHRERRARGARRGRRPRRSAPASRAAHAGPVTLTAGRACRRSRARTAPATRRSRPAPGSGRSSSGSPTTRDRPGAGCSRPSRRGLDAVHEVEPRHAVRLVAGEAVDRLHEAAAVAVDTRAVRRSAFSADWPGAARAAESVRCPNPRVTVTIAARGPLGGVATEEPQAATVAAVRTRPARVRAPIWCATGSCRRASPAPGRCRCA